MINTAEESITNASEDAACRVKRDMFVDNFITAVDCVGEEQKVVGEVLQLLVFTGFKLRKWSASDEDILRNVSSEDRALHNEISKQKNPATTHATNNTHSD